MSPAARVRPNANPEIEAAQERLQKVLARAGIGSRRACEALIRAGLVTVDDAVVSELGARVDPERARIQVEGKPLRGPRGSLTLMLHKPKGYECTRAQNAKHPSVMELAGKRGRGLFPVGRLDVDSEGLLLLTNDGELAYRVTHPRYEVPRIYRVKVRGQVEAQALARLRRGIHLAEGAASVRAVTIEHRSRGATWLRITLTEGRNREVRRILARTDHKVLRLVRIGLGPLRLGKLPQGACHTLTRKDLEEFRRRKPSPPPAAPRRAGPPRSRPRARSEARRGRVQREARRGGVQREARRGGVQREARRGRVRSEARGGGRRRPAPGRGKT